MSTYVLGVDAGNSKTIALVARADGVLIGAGRSGCGDIYGTQRDLALHAMRDATMDALRQAGITRHDLNAAVFSAAGADWPEDFVGIRQGLVALDVCGDSVTPIICNDALGGLRAGAPDGTGVVVVCGTGTAVGARSPEGHIWHSSFWQGSHAQGATQLGSMALDAVLDAELGLAAPTALTNVLLTHFRCENVEALLHLMTRHGGPHPPKKQLAKMLLDVAEAGDAVAHHIVLAHGHGIGGYAVVAAQRVGFDAAPHRPFHLVLAGGVLRHPSNLLRDAIVARVQKTLPAAQPIRSAFEPAVGAIMLALEAASVRLDAAVLDRLRHSMPHHDTFAT